MEIDIFGKRTFSKNRHFREIVCLENRIFEKSTFREIYVLKKSKFLSNRNFRANDIFRKSTLREINFSRNRPFRETEYTRNRCYEKSSFRNFNFRTFWDLPCTSIGSTTEHSFLLSHFSSRRGLNMDKKTCSF